MWMFCPWCAPGRWRDWCSGLVSVRYIETLFYQVKATDAAMLAAPSLIVVAVALVAALPRRASDPRGANRSGDDAARRIGGSACAWPFDG